MPNKLTKRAVDALVPDPHRDQLLWCGEVRGFGVRVKGSGATSFIIQYRNAHRRSCRLTLGTYGVLTVEQARELAKMELVKVLKGADPAYARKAARAMTTVAELCDIYLAEVITGQVLHRGKPKKSSTIATDTGRINRHIKPLVGQRAIAELERKHVEAMYSAIVAGKTKADIKTKLRGVARVRGGPGTAVKSLDLLSSIYRFAIRKGLVDRNPCLGIETPADNRRTRYLSPEEYERLGKALVKLSDEGLPSQVRHAIEALALTGCRKNEILTLLPKEINVAGRCLRA